MNTIKSKNGSVVSVVVADRKFVDTLLANNDHNRRLNVNRVDSICRDIKEGRWVMNGATVVVSADGKLLDGQHRLEAIRKAGYPALELIVTTVGDESGRVMDKIDCGAARTGNDILTLMGIPNSSSCGSIANVILTVFSEKRGKASYSKSELVEVYSRHKDMIDKFAGMVGTRAQRAYFASSTIAVFCAFAIAYPERIDDLIGIVNAIVDADGLVKGTVQHSLNRYLVGIRQYGRLGCGSRRIATISAICGALFKFIDRKPCLLVKEDRPSIERLVKAIAAQDGKEAAR